MIRVRLYKPVVLRIVSTINPPIIVRPIYKLNPMRGRVIHYASLEE